MFKNKYLRIILLATSSTTLAFAQTDAFPTKTIRIVVPFAPGGSVDLISRMISPKMSELLGQQIVVDNRAGASGNIGTEQVARSVSDTASEHLKKEVERWARVVKERGMRAE